MSDPVFSLAFLTVKDCSPPEMTYLAARVGYDLVSFRPIPMGLAGEPRFELGADKGLLRRTKVALAETGLGVLDIEVARILDGVDVKSYLPAMEAGAELGCRHVLTSAWTPDRNYVLDSFSELCDLARPLGLTVDFEAVAFAAFATLGAVYDVVRAAARPNAGILIDTLHFALAGAKPEEISEIPPQLFHFAQVCDARIAPDTTQDQQREIARDGRLYLGEGDIDVAAITARLPQIPYSLELPNTERVRTLGYEEHARRCLTGARQYFQQLKCDRAAS